MGRALLPPLAATASVAIPASPMFLDADSLAPASRPGGRAARQAAPGLIPRRSRQPRRADRPPWPRARELDEDKDEERGK
jgi:hypothetical protein